MGRCKYKYGRETIVRDVKYCKGDRCHSDALPNQATCTAHRYKYKQQHKREAEHSSDSTSSVSPVKPKSKRRRKEEGCSFHFTTDANTVV